MDDLIAFLREMIDTDERRARAVEPLGYTTDLGGKRLDEHFTHGRIRYASEDAMPRHDTSDPAAAAHFAVWEPNRVLAEVDSKRALVKQFELRGNSVRATVTPSTGGVWDDLLRLLALPYADHPDYNESWRP